jgi:hypothetical protein
MRVMEEEADARDRRMRLSATTFHFHPMRHAERDAPPAFSAESAAAAAAVRSISEREGRAGMAAALAKERLQNPNNNNTSGSGGGGGDSRAGVFMDPRTMLGDLSNRDRTAAVVGLYKSNPVDPEL